MDALTYLLSGWQQLCWLTRSKWVNLQGFKICVRLWPSARGHGFPVDITSGDLMTMKLITAVCFALVASSGPAMAQENDTCLPYLAVSKFITLMKEGEEPSKAFEHSMSKNFDGSESCAVQINAEFKRRNMPAPFE